MSGVCGIVSRTDDPVDHTDLAAMVAAAPHRSAGGHHGHLSSLVGLAQLLGTASADPAAPAVHGPSGIVVVADARIDNRSELVRALVRALGPDAPAADTGASELILGAYLAWGLDALPRLIGDFAFVLWDPRHRRTVLARDPLAMRALYYRIESRRVLVATEVKQLLAVPGVPDEPDERMAAAYLCGSFGSPTWSYYRGIEQVAASHAVLFEGTRVRSWRYWDVDPGHTIEHRAPHDYAEQLRELFVEAVRARLRTDRSAGILLSGGIDSGAAASAAGWLIERGERAPRSRTYSWDFGSFTMCDERAVSRHIVERYALPATDVAIEDAGPLSGYPAHAPDLDDPFHGHFQTMLDRGFAAARGDGVGPLFTGMRGDLAIGPVDVDYGSLLRAGRLVALGGELRRQRLATREGLASIVRRDVTPIARQLARRSAAADWARYAIGRRDRRPRRASSGEQARVPAWIDPGLARRTDLSELLETYAESPAPPLEGPLRRRRYEWIFMPMHLRWAVSHERRVATFGMEAVDPWSDRRIVEFCLAVPQQVLDRPGAVDKQLVRDALAGIMPRPFLDAAGKTVPTPLYRETLRTTAAPAVDALLRDARSETAGWIRSGRLREDYARFRAGGRPPDQLWWALSLEWWLRAREPG